MKNSLLTLLVIYLLLLVLLYVFQRSLLYYPTTAPLNSDFGAMSLPSNGLSIQVVTDNTDAEHAIIYFGGNAENVWQTPQQMKAALHGFAAYYMNYPGYGGSSGAPQEETILRAASDLYDYVQQRHASVTVIGRSLGTGVAVAVASEHDVAGVILISPYDSIANVAAGHYPLFPTRWLVKDKFDSVARATSINTNVLVLIASDDNVVPPKHSVNLIGALEKRTSAYTVEEVVFAAYQHNNIDLHPEFNDKIRDFLKVSAFNLR